MTTHTAPVKLVTRDEDGRPVRVVEWSENSSSDLGMVVWGIGLTIAVAGLALAAWQTSGWVRVICLVLAIVVGLYWAAIMLVLGTVVVGISIVRGLLTPTPTRLQRAALAVLAALVGAAMGSATYETGPAVLIVVPLVAAAVVVVVRQSTSSQRIRVQSAVLSGVAAAAALAVGCTVFL